MELPDKYTNRNTKEVKGKHVLPDFVLQHPKYKPFFDTIIFILSEMEKQNSKVHQKLFLPKKMDLEVVSNYGITAQFWFDYNFGIEYGITIERT